MKEKKKMAKERAAGRFTSNKKEKLFMKGPLFGLLTSERSPEWM